MARVPSVEQLRFTNSGSEATMLAVEIARVATGRRKVLMARYGYHGSAPHFECGTFGHEGPDTLLATYDDPAAFEAVLAERGDEVAAVILEPVMGSGGLVAATAEGLERIGAGGDGRRRGVRPGRGHHAPPVAPAARRPCSASRPT